MASCRRKRPRKRLGGLDRWLPLFLLLLLLRLQHLPLHHQFSHRGLQNPGRKAGPPSEIEREGRGKRSGSGEEEMVVGERPFNERWVGSELESHWRRPNRGR